MIIEFHDNASVGEAPGTLGACVEVDYTYQAELWVQEELVRGSPFIRAFAVIPGSKALAAWQRCPDGKTLYIAHASGYGGQWELPFVHGEAKVLVSGVVGRNVPSLELADAWAANAFHDQVGCAVLLDDLGLVAAWERGENGPVMTARSPRPMPGTLR